MQDTLCSLTFSSRLAKELQSRSHQFSVLRLARNETLYTCGQRADHLYLAIDGWVKSTMVTRCGKSCLLDIYSRDDIIGESCLVGGSRHDTVTAMTAARLLKIPRSVFLDIVAEEQLVAECLSFFVRRNTEQEFRITQLITSCCEKRLARMLLYLGSRHGDEHAGNLYLRQRISQQELSEMIGTTRSRVGYFMQRFKKFGLISHVPNTFLAIHEQRIHAYLAEEG
ncbi:MAG: Crp/Fnr family transcriptional regulator [Catenulispora sp.]|nr:Crp/Fnr family transcriptional regulator [Catenulispora sp.]